ncbi:glycerophosphodiester phosphodiesterase GDPD4 isoform X1 [Typha latifolia]|uniref:glycerophosphodiester phosphodiesterase GDPD4 isoform X1 n=2 Tax=Typha latifolia TaxID=4733 RepID=UPI003C2D005B
MTRIALPRKWRSPTPSLPLFPSKKNPRASRSISSNRFLRLLLLIAFFALIPPLVFHFRLRRIHQMRSRKCGWIENPPLVCAHGGDSTRAAPNTLDAYRIALSSRVDCVEIDVSRTLDGALVALHDRDLQRMSGNSTTKVGYMKIREIKELDASFGFGHGFRNQDVPLLEDALALISKSVRQVILDVKVGPPLYERGLAEVILSIVKKTHCMNCLIWSKSDIMRRDIIKLSRDAMVGYIVMKDSSTGARSNLLRMEGAKVVGIYHPLIDENLMRILHRKGKKAYAWTVDDSDSMLRMLSEHVDAVVTSNPSLLQSRMQDLKMECIEEGFPLP